MKVQQFECSLGCEISCFYMQSSDFSFGNCYECAVINVRKHTLPYFLQTVAEHGKAGFYEGRVAEAIVQCVQSHGGVMTLEDLKDHKSTFDQPIKKCYRGINVWEMPPNGQGITALIALNILGGFDFTGLYALYCV